MTRNEAREDLVATLRALELLRPLIDLGNHRREAFNSAWGELMQEAEAAAEVYVEACRG